jgi:polar amino acid transport system substrate-binding protein
MRTPLIALALALAAAALPAAAEKVVPAYNTYQSVPFQVGGEGGLAADVVGYLNAKLKGKYTFTLDVMPRDKFNQVIAGKSFEGVSMFLAPQFVGDGDKKKFLWTAPLMSDSNLIVSNPAKKVEYAGPESLKGLKFGGVTGNRYAGLDAIPRTADTAAELTNLKNAASGEIDVTLVPESIFRYYLKTSSNARFGLDKLHVSGKTHATFTRHFFVSPDQAELARDLDAVVAKMPSDPAWKEILAKYGARP